MRVNVDGNKYTVCSDDKTGRLWVERGDCKDWLMDPPGGKMLTTMAYELACLRQIAKLALELTQTAGVLRVGQIISEIEDRRRYLAQYTDFERNLNDPPDL
jgi:hypothetical protein